MAIRGRKPKPAQEKLTTDNPGHRPIAKEPEFTPGDNLSPPKRWSKRGQERVEWGRIVPDLQRAGIARMIHQGILEKICELYAASVILYKEKDYMGARQQTAEYRKALNEFGLTAASAGRVGWYGGNGSTPKEADEEEFFTGPRAVND